MMIRLFAGFDQTESIAFHVLNQSIIDNTSVPVAITPLDVRMPQTDGSNQFVYSRFLVPELCEYKGWALFMDSDMVFLEDIAKLWELRDERYAVQVVKHDYKTKHPIKYLGNKNEDYFRKNWSSLILWNCAHPANRALDYNSVSHETGQYLHRFSWLLDTEIGELPLEWNWLASEYPSNPDAKLVHYTIGTPCFKQYASCEMSSYWKYYYHRLLEGLGK
jgi:lipopolysaccharide biosynthesis glycosyltransferase